MKKISLTLFLLFGVSFVSAPALAVTPDPNSATTLANLFSDLEALDQTKQGGHGALEALANRTLILRAEDWREANGLAFEDFNTSWLTINFPQFFGESLSILRLGALETPAQCIYFQLLLQDYAATTNCGSFNENIASAKTALCKIGMNSFCLPEEA